MVAFDSVSEIKVIAIGFLAYPVPFSRKGRYKGGGVPVSKYSIQRLVYGQF